MNKRFIKYFWALPLLGMLSSCSDSSVTENSQNASNAINFSVTTSKQSSSDGTVSRATIVDNSVVNAPNSSFGLYASSDPNGWTPGTAPTATPNFMNDQKVDYDNGSWTYDPLKFWSSDKVSFFAYWPYTAGVTHASAVAGAMPQVEFTQKMDAENMVDFIASHAINLTRDDGVVTLDFKHVLTRLNFKARLDEKLKDNSSTHIFIKEMKICGTDGSTTAAGGTKGNDASRFFSKATFVLGDGKGTPDPTDQTGKKYLNDAEGQWKYEAETSPVINKAEAQPTAMDLKKLMPITTTTLHSDDKTKDITGVELKQSGDTIGLFKPTAEKKQHYLFLIPPHGIEGIKSNTDVIVELKYEIATADPSLIPEKFTPADERTVAVSLPNGTLQQGKAYNIVFTVGLDPVKVEANVTDWDTDLIENAPEDKAENNEATGILAAWARLNATKAQDETANYFVIKVDKKPTGNLDLRSTVAEVEGCCQEE